MDHFLISDLSRLAGIKAFTIRAWEKRYHALNPERTEGNTRYYNNKQLRRLLNIVGLLEFGHKPSELCVLKDSVLFRMVEEQKGQPSDSRHGFFQTQLIAAGYTYDEGHFSNIFSQCLARYGVRDTYIHILYPMLKRIGILWSADRVNAANEHFITHLIRQKILTAIDLLPSPPATADSWLLFLPEDEFHEVGLLVAHYLIRLSGKRSIYLGPNLPLEALASATSVNKPGNVLLFFIHNNAPEETAKYLRSLAAAAKHARIFVAGKRLAEHGSPAKRLHFLETVEDLERLLR